MTALDPEARRLFDTVRSFARSGRDPFRKAAGPVLGAQDTSFEQAMSNLAHAYLRNQAPGLLPYEVGFQLLKKNEDNTRAAAVIGFKAGTQWLFVPIFFLNGEMKGYEMIYHKNRDRIVPLEENWLNSILNRRPDVLGEPVDRNSGRLGMVLPDLQSFRRPFSSYSKYGSYRVPDWCLPGAARVAKAATANPARDLSARCPSLADFVVKEAASALPALLSLLRDNQSLAEGFERFHGRDVLKKAAAAFRDAQAHGVLAPGAVRKEGGGVLGPDAALTRRKAAGLKLAAKVEVLTFDEPGESSTDLERARVLSDGFVVRDTREEGEVSKAYTEQSVKRITNPDESGVYDVLVKPGEFRRCLVLIDPLSDGGREDVATVVSLGDGDGGEWVNAHPSRVWVNQKQGKGTLDSATEYNEWLKGRPGADTLPERNEDADDVWDGPKYLLAGPGGKGTVPFRVKRTAATAAGRRTTDVWFDGYSCHGRVGGDAGRRDGLPDYGSPFFSRVTFTEEDAGRLHALDGEVLVPKGFKLLKVGDKELALGNDADLQRLLYAKTAALKVSDLGGEVEIMTDAGAERFSPVGAAVRLVAGHGLREDAARAALKEARERRVCRLRIKYADQYPWPGMDATSTAPPFPERATSYDPYVQGAVIEHPTETYQPANTPDSRLYPGQRQDPFFFPDPTTLGVAARAARTGQKEVYDASMIGTILQQVGDGAVIDRHIGPLEDALDAMGSILMGFWWHNDDFRERYGKSELPELEDGLRNTFKRLGDIVFKLKQKSVDPIADAGDVDLRQAASD